MPTSTSSPTSQMPPDADVRKFGRFAVTGTLAGRGKFAKVFVAYDTSTKKKVAARIASLEDENPVEEAKVLKKLHRRFENPYVIEFYQKFDNEKVFVMFLEFCEGGSLEDVLNVRGHLPLPVCRRLFAQLAQSLWCLHDLQLFHRDLKPANIMLTSRELADAEIRLIDFGFARHASTMMHSMKGSPAYMAPERLLKEQYGFPAEVYSAGLVLFQMVYGHQPFKNVQTMMALYQEQKNVKLPDSPSDVPPEAKELIMRCLDTNPDARPTADELLAHPFVAPEIVDRPIRRRSSSPSHGPAVATAPAPPPVQSVAAAAPAAAPAPVAEQHGASSASSPTTPSSPAPKDGPSQGRTPNTHTPAATGASSLMAVSAETTPGRAVAGMPARAQGSAGALSAMSSESSPVSPVSPQATGTATLPPTPAATGMAAPDTPLRPQAGGMPSVQPLPDRKPPLPPPAAGQLPPSSAGHSGTPAVRHSGVSPKAVPALPGSAAGGATVANSPPMPLHHDARATVPTASFMSAAMGNAAAEDELAATLIRGASTIIGMVSSSTMDPSERIVLASYAVRAAQRAREQYTGAAADEHSSNALGGTVGGDGSSGLFMPSPVTRTTHASTNMAMEGGLRGSFLSASQGGGGGLSFAGGNTSIALNALASISLIVTRAKEAVSDALPDLKSAAAVSAPPEVLLVNYVRRALLSAARQDLLQQPRCALGPIIEVYGRCDNLLALLEVDPAFAGDSEIPQLRAKLADRVLAFQNTTVFAGFSRNDLYSAPPSATAFRAD